MAKLVAIVFASCVLAGCERPDEYRVYYNSMGVEEQMKILQCLESNDWEHIGISVFEGHLVFVATRKGAKNGK